jgi:prepilin-type N-terminal cleavage/methylation domain-containing protein
MKTRTSPVPSGFTLIEVVITLCVFVLLAAAVFSIFGATLESAAGLQDNQARNDQTEALGAWFKRSLLDMPANGTVVSYRRDDIPFHVAGLVWGAGNDLRALDLHLQANGEYTLRLAAYQPSSSSSYQVGGLTGLLALPQFVNEVERDDSALAWRTLVHDLKAADWRFLPFNTDQWLDASLGQKPAIVELTFQQAGATAPVTEDFWIPPTQLPRGVAIPTTPAVSSNP